MKEATKAMRRRTQDPKYQKFFKGTGVDVGCGNDCIIQFKKEFNKMRDVRAWDIRDGDGQYLRDISDFSLDFVHSSHSLEHMRDWKIALTNWLRVVKKGGYVIVSIPEWEMYEHKQWPSRSNSDHKWAFSLNFLDVTIFAPVVILSVPMLEEEFSCKVEILQNIEIGYDPSRGYADQTADSGTECAIEMILKKL